MSDLSDNAKTVIHVACFLCAHLVILSAVHQRHSKKEFLLAGSGNLNPMSLFFMSIVYAFSQKLSYISQSNNIDITRTCYLSMNYLLARALRLLCVESYVLMCPFYYSNYQSILFCVESLIKFLAHNDVCVCRFIVPYFLTLP